MLNEIINMKTRPSDKLRSEVFFFLGFDSKPKLAKISAVFKAAARCYTDLFRYWVEHNFELCKAKFVLLVVYHSLVPGSALHVHHLTHVLV